jgi:alpha-N-arabinofuranosidase
MDLAWHAEESNRFGTDEFMRYCELVGAEPYLCVNVSTGTMEEAQAWVGYCNGTGETYWANQRRANGHDEPYRVRLWGLGNEMYGAWQIGQLSAADYVTAARQFAKVSLIMAGSVLAIVPMVIAFLLIQRRFVDTIATSGLR